MDVEKENREKELAWWVRGKTQTEDIVNSGGVETLADQWAWWRVWGPVEKNIQRT